MLPVLRSALFALVCAFLIPFQAAAWDRGEVQRFATLPAGAANPEGIAVDRHGDVYVTGFNPTGAGVGKVFVFGDNGHLKRILEVSGASSALLGIAFHPGTHELLVVDIGQGAVAPGQQVQWQCKRVRASAGRIRIECAHIRPRRKCLHL
jgi:hypothetical protein